jgi:hypothetical protein
MYFSCVDIFDRTQNRTCAEQCFNESRTGHVQNRMLMFEIAHRTEYVQNRVTKPTVYTQNITYPGQILNRISNAT